MAPSGRESRTRRLLGKIGAVVAITVTFVAATVAAAMLHLDTPATRRLVASAHPPVVLLLSTYDDDEGEQFTAESGAIGYVTKSAFGPDRLTAAWLTGAR